VDILGICSQAVAVISNVSGIKAAFDYDATPESFDRVDLPAAIPLVGPMAYRDFIASGSRAEGKKHEAQDYILRVYVTPVTQGIKIGEAVATTGALIPLVLAAFDGRPHLVNADGLDEDDFDSDAAGLTLAGIVDCSGVVIRQYGEPSYFAVEFTLRCDGHRVTSKIGGN
jgi:hypothetical protein